MKNRMNKHIFLVMLASLLLVITACGTQSEKIDEHTGQENNESENQNGTFSKDDNPIVTITMENGKEITIELYPEVAPNTVANFVSLVEAKFYDGLIFHRVIPGFMIQGGDPLGTGMGGPDYSIKGEFSANGFENNLKHERGVISMARALDPNSAGSQFFIMTEQATHLDGEYAAFGKVIEGMDVVDEIVAAERDADNKPFEDQRMKTVIVDTKGKDYPDPEVE